MFCVWVLYCLCCYWWNVPCSLCNDVVDCCLFSMSSCWSHHLLQVTLDQVVSLWMLWDFRVNCTQQGCALMLYLSWLMSVVISALWYCYHFVRPCQLMLKVTICCEGPPMMKYGCVSHWLQCDIYFALFWWILSFCPAMSTHIVINSPFVAGDPNVMVYGCLCGAENLRLNCQLVWGDSASRRWGWSLCWVQILGIVVLSGCKCRWRWSMMWMHWWQRLDDQCPSCAVLWLTGVCWSGLEVLVIVWAVRSLMD